MAEREGFEPSVRDYRTHDFQPFQGKVFSLPFSIKTANEQNGFLVENPALGFSIRCFAQCTGERGAPSGSVEDALLKTPPLGFQ